MADLVGQQFGKYRLIRLLGQGGFADVYLGEHVQLGSQAAIKVLHTRISAEDQEELLKEARTIARLVHPNIVSILDYGVEGGVPFLVMRYAPGGTLRQRHPRGRPLAPSTIAPYIRQVAEALQFAHDQRLIHRDIKPENMLVGPNGEILLSDFGVALLSQSSSRGTQDSVGTVAYMAPEQLQGHPRAASDQYALAVVAYEWLTGERLFQGSFTEVASQHLFSAPPPLRVKVPGIAPLVEQVVLTALSKAPEQRFGTVRAFATAFEQACLSQPPILFDQTQVKPPGAPVAPPGPPGITPQPGGPALTPPPLTTQPQVSLPFAPTQLTPPTPAGPMALPTPSGQDWRVSAPPPSPAGGAPPEIQWANTFTRPSGGPPNSGQWPQSGPGAPAFAALPGEAAPKRKGRTLLLALLALVILVGGSGLVIWARSTTGTTPQNGRASATTIHATATATQPPVIRGGTVTDALFQEPDSLLSNGSVETFAALVDATIWAPLVYGDAQSALQPGLLKEVPTVANGDISADGRSYTLKLRSGLKWSDGQPLTADDVVFTLNLWNNPAYGAQYQTVGLPFLDFSSLRAVDETTVTFSMKQVYVPVLAQQLADPALAPMPKHIFGSMNPASILKSNENFQPSVVSGPFEMQDRVKGDHITVVRNPNYYQASQGLPYLDKIVFQIIPDSATILTALQAGTVDTAWFLDITKLDSYKALQGYSVYADKNPATFEEILFNLHNAILSDLQVRKAISMSIDLDSIIKVVLKGTAQRTCDEAVGSFAHNASQTCYPFDPAGAKSLLDNDGWTVGSDGYRHKNGLTLELRWSSTANNARRQQTEVIAQANLKDVGIKIDILNYPAGTLFGQTLPQGNFDIGEYANTLGYDPDNPFIWLCKETPDKDPSGSNWGFYCNPAVDQAINTEETNPDQNVRLQAFRTFQQAVLTDLPVEYLYAYGNLAVARTNIHNYDPSGTGPSETWNVWQWWKG